MQEEIPLSPTRQTALASGAVAATAEVLPDDLFEIQVNDPLHIAHALQKRFENGQRVTWLGSDAAVFISNIENNSSNSNESSFNDRKDMNIFPNYSLSPPNLPSITNLIYHHIFLDKRNRTILFSGLSGSGKTSALYSMLDQFLLLASPSDKFNAILHAAQNILNAFGCAKTSRNSSETGSTRYSVCYKLFFEKTSQDFCSAQIVDLELLEKSRLTSLNLKDNFQIFYWLVGTKNSFKSDFYLANDYEKYKILSGSLFSKGGKDSMETCFLNLLSSMKTLGLNLKYQKKVFSLVAAILHLCNIEFEEDESNSNFYNNNSNMRQEPTSIKNEELLEIIAELLGVTEEDLFNALVYKTKVFRNETCTLFLNSSAARRGRDVFARTIYGHLWKWIVSFVNTRLKGNTPLGDNVFHVSMIDSVGMELNSAPMDNENICLSSFESFLSGLLHEKVSRIALEYLYVGPLSAFDSEEFPLDGIQDIELPDTLSLYNPTAAIATTEIASSIPGLLPFIQTETKKYADISLEKDHLFNDLSVSLIEANPHRCLLVGPFPTSSFKITHYLGTVSYDSSSILDYNLNSNSRVSSDLLSLVLGTNGKKSKNNFLVGLFKDHSNSKSKNLSTIENYTIALEKTLPLSSKKDDGFHLSDSEPFIVYTLKQNDENMQSLVSCFHFSEIIQSSLLGGYFKIIPISDFMSRFEWIFESNSSFFGGSTTGQLADAQKILMLLQTYLKLTPKADFHVGHANVCLKKNSWNQLQSQTDAFMIAKNQVFMNNRRRNATVDSSEGGGFYPHSLNHADSTTNFLQQSEYLHEGDHGVILDDDGWASASEYTMESRRQSILETDSEIIRNLKAKGELIDLPPGTTKLSKQIQQQNNKENLSKARRIWLVFVTIFTFYIPEGLLVKLGRMKVPEVRLAWREKVTLCWFILLLSAFMLFYIIGFTLLLCPPQKVLNGEELRNIPVESPHVVVHGSVYDLTKFAQSHSTGIAKPATIFDFSGKDASALFPFKPKCGAFDDTLVFNCTALGHSFCHTEPYMFNTLKSYKVGSFAFSLDDVAGHSTRDNAYVIVGDNVYNVTRLLLNPESVLSSPGQRAIAGPWGREVSGFTSGDLACLSDYFAGVLDKRNSASCIAADYILIGSTAIVVAVMVFKFLSALQLGSRREPEELDKFAILQVPCYTEGEESIRKTLNSLATLKYDDKRKLLFIIADGMIIGSGNDAPTPRIVLDILGVDPEMDDVPALDFISLGEGAKQGNRGKVYSGLYETAGHTVPYIVVVKVGREGERSKPGNRGKRDSQMILLRFLNKVHFDLPMSPLELEIYSTMKNVIGIDPAYYEFILMVDADTEVLPDSLNRMISCMIHDTKVMGICGETEISNEKESWITMIQVYEYYISHHLAKAFESLFGSVTCLPGCFCMYRIKTPFKNSPLIIHSSVLNDYSENNVDTLHKKNLLSLGEDRYLTTLMLKYFPSYKMTFTPDAGCKTSAPESWPVLLSQRRRWINSTIHNLFELMLLPKLCGFCCFSMRFVVFLDLFATLVMPATVAYLVYLIVSSIQSQTAPIISLILIGAVYGMQVIIFLLKRQWQHIGWMIVYILAIPIFSFFIPLYAYWHFDDFSWGNTRLILGGDGKKQADESENTFDPSTIPLKRFTELENEKKMDDDLKASLSAADIMRSVSTTSFNNPPGLNNSSSNFYGGGFTPVHHPAATAAYETAASSIPRPRSAASLYVPDPRAYNIPSNVNNSFMRNSSYGELMNNQNQMNAFGSNANLLINRSGSTNSFHAAPTDAEITFKLKELLANADLMKVTKKGIRTELQGYFNADLSSKRDFINESIERILQGEL